MPIIHIHLMEGRPDAAKHQMMARVTQAVADTLDVPAASVRIIVQDIASGHFSAGGAPKFAPGKAPSQG